MKILRGVLSLAAVRSVSVATAREHIMSCSLMFLHFRAIFFFFIYQSNHLIHYLCLSFHFSLPESPPGHRRSPRHCAAFTGCHFSLLKEGLEPQTLNPELKI